MFATNTLIPLLFSFSQVSLCFSCKFEGFDLEVLSEFERGALKIKLLGHQDRYRAREKQEDPGIDWRAVEEEGRSLGELLYQTSSFHKQFIKGCFK